MGDVAIEACLAAYPTAFDENLRDSIASALRRSAIKGDRMFHAPVDFLKQSPELGAIYLAESGDSRAVPALFRKFDALPVVDRDGAMTATHWSFN